MWIPFSPLPSSIGWSWCFRLFYGVCSWDVRWYHIVIQNCLFSSNRKFAVLLLVCPLTTAEMKDAWKVVGPWNPLARPHSQANDGTHIGPASYSAYCRGLYIHTQETPLRLYLSLALAKPTEQRMLGETSTSQYFYPGRSQVSEVTWRHSRGGSTW